MYAGCQDFSCAQGGWHFILGNSVPSPSRFLPFPSCIVPWQGTHSDIWYGVHNYVIPEGSHWSHHLQLAMQRRGGCFQFTVSSFSWARQSSQCDLLSEGHGEVWWQVPHLQNSLRSSGEQRHSAHYDNNIILVHLIVYHLQRTFTTLCTQGLTKNIVKWPSGLPHMISLTGPLGL